MKRAFSVGMTWLLVAMIGLCGVGQVMAGPTKTSAPVKKTTASKTVKPSPKPAPKAQVKIIAYYFHGNARCSSCMNIEGWTDLVLKKNYAADLKSGKLEWKVINVQAPGNERFARAYSISSSSVVLSEVKNGKQVRWKNLNRVWDLLGEAMAFERYIRDEVDGFRKAK